MDRNQYPYYYSNNANQTAQQNSYSDYSRANDYTQRQTSSATPAQSYSNYQQQNPNYDTSQSQTQHGYNDQGYYGSRDGGQRAAETLSRMGTSNTPAQSSTAYQSNSSTYSTAYSQPTSTQYTSTLQNQTSTYPSQSNYSTAHARGLSQGQARPSSVNSVRSNAANVNARSPVVEPMQQPRQAMAPYNSRSQFSSVQRSASPAQIQASHQLQRMQQADQRTAQEPNVPQSTFVDPSAVYDPWPEYQRKLAAAKAQKEAEEQAAAEAAEAEAEEKRKAEEEEARVDEERKREEAEEKKRKKAEAAKKRAETKKAKEIDGSAALAAGGIDPAVLATLQATAAASGGDAEGQIRQLMAMVKSMNDKHPDLLAKIWEEERQQHLQGSTEETAAAPTEEASATATSKKKKSPKKKATGEPSKSTPNGAKAGKASKTPTKSATPAAVQISTPAPPVSAPTGPTPGIPTYGDKPVAAKGKTIWPPEKKGQLAKAATKWLSKIPANRGKTIVPGTIAAMLDKNPTYIELCELIEKEGFRVDRAAFAKALLSSVPDVNASRPAASPTIPRPASVTNGTSGPFERPSIPGPSQPAHSPTLPLPPTPITESPYYNAKGEQIPTSKPASASKKASNKKEASDTKSERPSETPGPATKADVARKRGIGDLIDLTALSDDDEPPAKMPYWGPPAPSMQPGQAYSTELDFMPNFNHNSAIDPHLQSAARQYNHNYQPRQSERQPMNPIAQKLNGMELAGFIDRRKALRRSGYKVQTLARDVLLATGKHPDLLPLNGHLESLRNHFPNAITLHSDLETVRWDLIDPGEPLPSMLEAVADDKDSVLEADDESEEEPVYPTVPRTSMSVSRTMAAHGRGSTAEYSALTSANHPNSGFGKILPSRGGYTPRGRGRGRPAGMARFSTGGMHTPNWQTTTPTSTPGESRAPDSAPTGGVGYAEFKPQLNPDGTKKRGRPVGWRKNIHMKGGPANYGSGSKPKPTVQSIAPPPPNFAVYKCEWKECHAELHNLAVLRQHVERKHAIPDKRGKHTCLWGQCGKTVQTIDPETGGVSQAVQHYDFPDKELIMAHVDQKHIGPIGWKLGNGPPGGGLSDSNATDSEAYLSDKQGRQVTPKIQAAAPKPASSTPAQPTPGRGRPPKKKDDEKARENQAHLAQQKREIGLGVDRGGATFANEKRRQGFVDDEEDEAMEDRSD